MHLAAGLGGAKGRKWIETEPGKGSGEDAEEGVKYDT